MKKIQFLLIIIIFFGCSKNDSERLTRDPSLYDYFPEDKISFERKFRKVNDYNTLFWISGYDSKISFSRLKDSCHYSQDDTDYHHESYSLIKDGNNISYMVTEKHSYLKDGYVNPLPVEISSYNINLVKDGLELGDKWTETKELIFDYNQNSFINDTLSSVLNYEVVGFDEKMEFGDFVYYGVLVIHLDYTVGDSISFSKTFGFADGIGLVYLSFGSHEFYMAEYYR